MTLQVVHKALMSIGFSEYESRAYCALLNHAPANGYEVARRSGIPRAKVYECLERLVARGAAAQVETSDSKAQVFAPTDPKILLDNIEHDQKKAFEKVRLELREHLDNPQSVEVFWRVTSIQDLISRAIILIDGALKTLHVGLWSEEFREVYPHLKSAVERKVKMALILYSPHRDLKKLQELQTGAVQHCPSKRKATPTLGRQFTIVADHEKCITGSVFAGGKVEGAFTMNRGLVANALDLVNHEIYVERILSEVEKPVWKKYGKNLEHLNSFDPPGSK